jgi:hypothetical protein
MGEGGGVGGDGESVSMQSSKCEADVRERTHSSTLALAMNESTMRLLEKVKDKQLTWTKRGVVNIHMVERTGIWQAIESLR